MGKTAFESITDSVVQFATERFDRSRQTISLYKRCWRDLKNFMNEQNISELDVSVCERYLLNNCSNNPNPSGRE